MRKFFFVTLLVLASSSANAQTRTTTGNTSNTGSTSATGTGNAATTGAASTQFGQAFNFGSNGFAATGMTSPFGNSTTTGRTGGMGMGGMGMGMGGMGGMGMMGMGGMGMGGMGMGGMGMGGRGQQQQGGRGGMGGTGQQQYTLRPTVKLGFDVPMPNSQARSQQIQVTMARLPEPSRFAGANISIVGRKAIVSGNVEMSQREVLKRLLLLEPGIYEVDMSKLASVTSVESSSTRADRLNAEAVPSPKE